MSAENGAARSTASRIVSAVAHDGRSLSQVGPEQLATIASERDRAFVQACAYGVLRHYHSLQARLATLMTKPLRRKDGDVEALLLLGLYQLEHLQVPAHAAVSATVDGARQLGKDWACRLVNGVLRAALRQPRAPDPTGASDYPGWLSARIKRDWPDAWPAVLAGGNAQAPLSLRVNLRRSAVAEYLDLLGAAGIVAVRGRHAPAALLLHEPVAISALPHFAEGWVTVQDEAAQLAATLLAPGPADRVLDACAAPGGKSAHLLELGAGDMVALDQSAARLRQVEENLARLGGSCKLECADAGTPATWWDGRPFDKILLDAPCSALGVSRRHPDIRLHRRAADIDQLAAEQRRLLAALWPLLQVGGRLLYATCSILPAENDDIIATLLTTRGDVDVVTPLAAWGRATRYGRQILPGSDAMDGFYYALLQRTAT